MRAKPQQDHEQRPSKVALAQRKAAVLWTWTWISGISREICNEKLPYGVCFDTSVGAASLAVASKVSVASSAAESLK